MEGIDYKGGSDYTRGVNKAILRNNLSFNGTIRNCDGAGIDASHNSWDISEIKVSADDFISIDTTGVFGPRKEDGSLPDVKFLRLKKGSDLIDKGEDVGLPFSGIAPDLGAFEFNENAVANKSKKHPNANTFIISNSIPDEIPTFMYDLSGRLLVNELIGKSGTAVIISISKQNDRQNQPLKILHLK
jgi:hypothetical protein